MRRGFFITGTDTNVGKTVVSSILCVGAGAAYWKPIQTGSNDGCDSDFLRKWTSNVFPEVYRFREPLSPHAAAKLEDSGISIDKIITSFPNTEDQIIAEGAGGIMVPLNEHHFMVDMIYAIKLPAIIVTSSSLGTINHTLLTLEALNLRNISIAGVVMVGERNNQNRIAIETYGQVPVIGEVLPCKHFTQAWMREEYQKFEMSIVSERSLSYASAEI